MHFIDKIAYWDTSAEELNKMKKLFAEFADSPEKQAKLIELIEFCVHEDRANEAYDDS
jgi:hypothetical protein